MKRALSHSISEGDGISILAEVVDGASARAAEEDGAKGLVVRGESRIDGATLPVLVYGASLGHAVACAADAIVITTSTDEEALVELAAAAHDAGIECVYEVRDEDDLQRVLKHVDPEIVLLGPDLDEDHDPVELILELLPDVPAGKLAIAALDVANRAEIEELERAGVDAVLVRGEIEPLVADTLPDV
ncbi:MAG: hypothetical protein ACKVUT_13015 [Gaiella sp.]